MHDVAWRCDMNCVRRKDEHKQLARTSLNDRERVCFFYRWPRLCIFSFFVIESPFLASLHENFLGLVERHPVKLLSYGETVPMKLSWMLQTVLVTNDSAGKCSLSYHVLRTCQFVSRMVLFEDLLLQVHHNGVFCSQIGQSGRPVLTNDGMLFTNWLDRRSGKC